MSTNTNKSQLKAVFTIIESDKLEKPLFRRIGTAFTNRDGSFNVFLDDCRRSGAQPCFQRILPQIARLRTRYR